MKLTILKGAVHSGKTTHLIEYCKNHPLTGGILSPVIQGKRYFQNIKTKELFEMEALFEEADTFNIGKYVFSAVAFKQAGNIIMDCINQPVKLIIIDEIGPLELSGKGFASTLNPLLSLPEPKPDLLLVVRENIIDAVIEYFHLVKQNIHIINTQQLSLL